MNDDLRPSTPAGSDTIMGALDDAAAQGFDTQLVGRDGGIIECTGCGQKSPPDAFHVELIRLLEGSSDAADLLLLVCMPCPECHRRGVLTLGYGPNADSADAAILDVLDIEGADASPDVDRAEAGTAHADGDSTDSAPSVNVLVGVDETQESRDAVATAWNLFGDRGVYTIMCVYERQPIMTGSMGFGTGLAGLYTQLDDSIGQQVATTAASTARSAAPDDADVSFHTDVGHAGSAIIDAATERASDVIVIGSHDRSFWRSLFSPSVGKYLVDHAPCPVLVVRSASS